jgi:CarD family transcriptional regulator
MAVKKATRAARKVSKRRAAPASRRRSHARANGSRGKSRPKSKVSKARRLKPSQQEAYIAHIRSLVKQRGATMKTFQVGDTVVEPSVGVCRIEGIKSQRVDEKTEDYYIFNSGMAKVYVPASQIETRGVRRPMTRDEIRRVYSQLKVPVHPNRGDARMQYLSYRDIMKSGDPAKISKLLRELFTLDKMDELKGKEKEIMEQAKKFLVDEISFIRDEPKAKVLEDIQQHLEQMYKRKVTKDREARAKRAAAHN